MASKHTTSIVDISEIEDDEVPLAASEQVDLSRHGQQQQQAQQQHQQQGGQGAQQRAQASQPTNSAHLYLYHEDLHPQQRIPNLLSNMILSHSQSQPQPQPQPQSADLSPGQTLLRPAGGLAAIDYHPMGGGQSALPYWQAGGAEQASANYGAQARPSASPDFDAGATCGRPTTPAPAGSEPNKANLGTLSGVYFPCVQNIFGVILFIRMVWIVGTAGVPAAFALVFICCCVTLTTSISLSAIATNGIVPAGGSYFMISRSLGPECGGAVGTMFFLGTTVAGAMYITGAVEIMLNYLAPSWGLFGDFQRDVSIMYNNIRVYGSLLLIIVGLMVWIGVRFVSKLAPIALFCVLFSIFSIYAGIFINYNGRQDLMICVVGDRLVTLKNMPFEEMGQQQQFEPNGGQFRQQIEQRNASKLGSAEQASLYELRRTRALCSYEKLRYIYCPNEEPTGQQADELQQQADEQVSGVETGEARRMRDLFKRPPNMSNCDPYFRANRDRIHLERAVPGK